MKSRKRTHFAASLAAAALIVVVLAGCSNANKPRENSMQNSPEAQPTNDAGFPTVATGSTSKGDVLVELTPLGFSNSQLRVSIAANTHSVDLSQFDLREITDLKINGKTIKPSDAPGMRGHHSSGTIVFEGVEEAGKFTIIIKGIPKTEERVFEWGESK